MTADELFAQFCKAKGIKPITLPACVRAALAPFAAKGLMASFSAKPSADDYDVAYHLIAVQDEAAMNVAAKASGQPYSHTESVYRRRTDGRPDPDIFVECVARIVMQPGALSDLDRRVARIGCAAREDRWGEVALMVAAAATSPAAPKDTTKALAVARSLVTELERIQP